MVEQIASTFATSLTFYYFPHSLNLQSPSKMWTNKYGDLIIKSTNFIFIYIRAKPTEESTNEPSTEVLPQLIHRTEHVYAIQGEYHLG